MSSERQNALDITKKLYDEMYLFYQANHIDQQETLDRFVQQNIQPLYPSKPVEDINHLEISDIVKRHYSKQHHLSFPNRKTSLGQFTEFQLDQKSQSQESDRSRVIYTNVIRRYKMKELCLKLGTGNFFCWNTSPPDKVYQDMGLSTCLYLKFVKHFIYALLIISPLIIFMLVMFYLTALDNEISPTTNYKKFIFSFSLGTLSLTGINCKHEKLRINNLQITTNLFCPVGKVRVLGPIYTQSLFESLENCRADIDNFVLRSKHILSSSEYLESGNCNSETNNCNYNIMLINPRTEYKQISITYECIDGELQLGALRISRNSLFYIVISFDLLSVVIISLFLWSQIAAEHKEEKYFKDKQLILNSFTLRVGPFSRQYLQEELVQFLQFLEGKHNHAYKIPLRCIVQIRLPDDPVFEKHQQRRKRVYNKIYELIGKNFLKQNYNPHFYTNQQDFQENGFKDEKKYKQYEKQLRRLVKQYKVCQTLKRNYYEGEIHILIVFEKPKYKRIIFENSNMGKIKIKRKQYQLKEVPSPELLLWENVQKWRYPRILLSIIITVGTMIGFYLLLAFIWSLRQRPLSKYNFNVDCQILYQSINLNFYDETMAKEDETATYIHCYCSNNSFLSINSEQLCKDWSARYFQYLVIPLLFSVILVALNIVLSIFYKKLSQFQAYHKVTSMLYSYIIKKTVLLILLLAMVITILNFQQQQKVDAFYFLYQGTYNDIPTDWYQQVGVIIIVTLVFNMITPLIEVLIYFGKKLVMKIKIFFFKRGPNYKKLKATYIQFFKNDIFPLQQRYAQLLAVSAICLTLSCVYPITIIVLIIEFSLFALIDKILIIKAYHKPINFQAKLHKKVIYSFFIIILLHLIVTAILLTEKYMLVAGSNSNSISIIDQTRTRISAIFGTNYTIPYMILAFLLLTSLVTVAVSNLYYYSKPNKSLKIGKDGIPFQEHKYYNLLNSWQLNKTLALKQKQWYRTKVQLESYFYNESSISSKNQQSGPDSDQLDSAQRMIILPSFTTPLPESSGILNFSSAEKIEEYSASRQQEPSSNNNQLRFIKTDISSTNGSILKKVIKYCYYKLLSRKQRNQKDRMRLTQLVGMTTYQHYEDWIFLSDHAKVNYKIQGF